MIGRVPIAQEGITVRDGVGDFEGEDFTCEVDLGGGWVEDTEDDMTGALITAKYYPGDPTSLRRFLAGPVAALTIDCYVEDGVAQPALAEVVDILLQRSHFVRRPAVSYRDVPAGPAVRLAGPFTQRVWGGLRREEGVRGHLRARPTRPPPHRRACRGIGPQPPQLGSCRARRHADGDSPARPGVWAGRGRRSRAALNVLARGFGKHA
jgi:hypothetical protein